MWKILVHCRQYTRSTICFGWHLDNWTLTNVYRVVLKLDRKFGTFGKSRKDYDDLLKLYKDSEPVVHRKIRVHAPETAYH